MDIKKVGVVGCGQMGAGITQVSAQSGYQVVVSEINDELLNKGLNFINSILTKNVDKGKLSQEDKDTIINRIKGTIDINNFNDCDLVIEAATEKIELKKKIFTDLDKVCPPHAILASNTSCLSIIDMAISTGRPEKVLGLHFFNPVPVMKGLEIVKTIITSEETLEISRSFGTSLGKSIVIAKDAPGFIVNNLLLPYLMNSIRMLESGFATKEDIDAAMRLGMNHPMGPLELSDLIGVDTVLYITSGIYEETKDPQYAPPTLLKKMVTAGWFGRKSGKGFYDY